MVHGMLPTYHTWIYHGEPAVGPVVIDQLNQGGQANLAQLDQVAEADLDHLDQGARRRILII